MNWKDKTEVEDYLKEISNFSLLSSAQEKKLVQKIREDSDKEVKQTLIKANLRLVVLIAEKYKDYDPAVSLGELIEQGNLGLTKAVEHYNYEKDYKFSTYATWWIREAIKSKLGIETDWVKEDGVSYKKL